MMSKNKGCKHEKFEIINNSLYACKSCSILGIIKEKTPTETKIKLLSKPYNYNLYNEVNIYDLIKNAINFYMSKNELIFKNDKKEKSIKNLELYLKYRQKLIKHTFNLCKGVNTTYECYYLSILLMDNVLNKIDYKINNYQLDLINTICFIISKKFNEKDNLKSESYKQYLTICHSPQKFINSNDLINIEIECLKILNYNLNIPTSLTILKYIFICGIIFANEIDDIEIKKIYEECFGILGSCVEQNEIYLNYNPIQVVFGIVYLVRKKKNLKKNIIKYFNDVFGIRFSYLKECIKIIDQFYYKENNNQKDKNIKQINQNNYKYSIDDNINHITKNKFIKNNIWIRSKIITPKKNYFSPIIKSKMINVPIIKNIEFGSATRLSALNLDDLDEETDDKRNVKSIIIVESKDKKIDKNFSKLQFFRSNKHR